MGNRLEAILTLFQNLFCVLALRDVLSRPLGSNNFSMAVVNWFYFKIQPKFLARFGDVSSLEIGQGSSG